jgi:Undecaprenyl-phosphate glucose phosphotransferase
MSRLGDKGFSGDAMTIAANLPEAGTPGADVSTSAEGNWRLAQIASQVAELYAAGSVAPTLVTGTIRILEFLGLLAASYFAHRLREETGGDGPAIIYQTAAVTGALLSILIAQIADAYEIGTLRSFPSQFARAGTSFVAALVALVLIGFLTKTSIEFSRAWFIGWLSFGLIFLMAFRAGVTAYVVRAIRSGRIERRAVIVGGGQPAAELIRALEADSEGDVRICGIFDDRNSERSPSIVAGYPKLGTVPALVDFARVARIDMLIVTLPLSAERRVLQLLKRLWVLPVDIRLSAHTAQLRFRPRAYSHEGSVPFLDIFDKPIANWDAISKRAFDILFSLLALVLLSPLMLATAIAIRAESKGPVIFRQRRYGFNNEVISVLKFRSMYHNMSDPAAKKVVTRGDPRVTRVGRLIRKTSIDELPQLVNVLKGELSLVGPRPHAVNAHTHDRLWDEVVDGYFARHKVKPGVTGWAQINGWRGEVDDEEKIRQRVNYDLYYIENWSLLFDFYICMMTPIRLMNTENAY